MNRSLILFCTILLVPAISFCQGNSPSYSTLEYHELKGNVTSFELIEYDFKVVGGDVVPDLEFEFSRYLYQFNKSGKLLTEKWVNEGDLLGETKLIYDNKDNIMRISSFDLYDENNNTKFEYSYDSNGNITETFYLNGALSGGKYSELNDKGWVVKTVLTSAEGTIESTSEFTLNDKGNVLDHKYYDEEGNLNGHDRFIVNSKNLRVEEINYDKYKDESSHYLYSYDQYNNMTAEKLFNEGELTEATYWEYKYDKYGNWIQKIELYENEPYSVMVRKIAYY